MRGWRVLVIAVLILCGPTAAVAQGQPPLPAIPLPGLPAPPAANPVAPPAISLPAGLDVPDLQQWLNVVVPPPPIITPAAPASSSADLPPALVGLQDAVMPKPAGDPMFDLWPPDLTDHAPGDILETRDVTAVAGPMLLVPVRQVLQVKFRTTDAHGAPSYATATLVIPTGRWAGPGSRPVLVNNLPIDALGRKCTPSYALAHGFSLDNGSTDYIPPTTQLAVLRGYAVLIPDHEGPRMAYAEPYVAGHAVLDSIRAARALPGGEFAGSGYAMHGYSGGAIATRGAVALIDSYAPELAPAILGAALGGVPVDYELLGRSMNANLASGIFLAATFGVARERPEMLARMNNLARWAAISPLKDTCAGVFALPGVLMLPIDLASDIPDPLHSEVATEIYQVTRMQGMKSAVPLYVYNGEQEWWIPAEGARTFYREQCALGVPAVYRSVPGEHIIAAGTGYPDAMIWLDQRLQGAPAPNEC
ncbi:lipase family protein [Nocardia blacklockiae]|uniref:lipase family protein n=1 Tax=Nocardia blacklockiae TaxID=480036 RepID=UPI001893D00B|nr:lipase family protein [Nocardia blacklockiae]MBF6175701.1 lipase [Nocardia blacklockiae]